MLKTLFLGIVFTFVSGEIYVDVKTTDGNDVSVSADGSDIHIISDNERESFHINDEKLANAVMKHIGVRPDAIYVKSPVPDRDLYKEVDSHGEHLATEIKRVFYVSRASVLETYNNSVPLLTKTYTNTKDIQMTVDELLNQTVEITLESSWSDLKTKIDFKNISYYFNIAGQHMAFKAAWGTEIKKNLPFTILSPLKIKLNHGESIQAILKAKEVTTYVAIKYFAYIDGKVVCHFKEKYQNENFLPFSIMKVMKDSNLRFDFYSNEVFKIVFYVDPHIEIKKIYI